MSAMISSINESLDTNETLSTSTSLTTKLYKKRYFILLLFVCLSMSNAFQWIEYAIIENIIVKYYDTTTFWVNCTSVVYMAAYIVGIIPATFLLDTKGLRFCILLGAFGNCFGSWIKCFSVEPNRFYVTMIGQSVVAVSQLFILNIPPLLAAIWFSDREVSRATAYGVFGNQVGIALGFFVPSLIVPNFSGNDSTHDSNQTHGVTTLLSTTVIDTSEKIIGIEEVGTGLRTLFFGVAVFTTLLFVLIVLFFKDKPDLPPSTAQANAQVVNENSSFISSLHALATNPNYVLLFFTYGLNTGVFYAVSTVLNQMVTGALGEEYVKEAGYMGFTLTLAGILGSIVCGYLLDWTKLFKQITLGVYILSLCGMIAFTIALKVGSVWFMFLVSGILGFFMTGYLPLGFELAAEISYPQPEGTSAGLLNASAQIFGVIFTFGGSAVIDSFNSLSANLGYVGALVLGSVLTVLIKADLRRQSAEKNTNNANNETKQLNSV
ncbi:unnamed protein product [Oppiella nova]|uniref:Major facilitator superfamily (MFS) profile domain-containing protein n=1 Tax=Oppiella nova TaxID=334625 RepID=A0A7R9LWN4_9ACAR|nr:unnamed protein product [Oppiella nova]CAG2167610.1 unnamed protein product [Oppiella nova]